MIRVQIHDQKVFFELISPRHEPTLRVEDDRVPVEDELVLAADEVAEDDVATVVGGPHAEHPLPECTLPPVVRGGRDVQEHARSSEGLFTGGTARIPDVLAHAHPHEGTAKLDDRGARTFAEVAVLVEDAVVWQV